MQNSKPTTSSPLLSVLLLPSLLLLVLLTSPAPCSGLDVGRLCAIRCKLGKGGNLCHCNAFHFAGKRNDGGVAAPEEEIQDAEEVGDTLQLGPRSLLELALRDVEEGHGGHSARALDAQGAAGTSRAGGRPATGRARGGDLALGAGRDGVDRREARPRGGGGEGRREGGIFDAREEEGEGEARAVMDRLSSLIKMALDERLIDSYEASRKRNRADLPYGEADLVY